MNPRHFKKSLRHDSKYANEASSNVKSSPRWAREEKNLCLLQDFCWRNIIWIYFIYLWNFYFSSGDLFLRWMLEFIFRMFILLFLIYLILESSFINFNRNSSTCCELKFIYIFITISNFSRVFWYLWRSVNGDLFHLGVDSFREEFFPTWNKINKI